MRGSAQRLAATTSNAATLAARQGHGRAGVPLYLYVGSGASEALVLPQLLTPGLVIESIEAA